MPNFKVVYIKQLNEIEPVPHSWEQDGVLYWPPTKSETRTKQCDGTSVPDPFKWTRYTCIVKHQGIAQFSSASKTADFMCQEQSSTEEEDVPVTNKKTTFRRASNPPSKYQSFITNFSDEPSVSISFSSKEAGDSCSNTSSVSILDNIGTTEDPGLQLTNTSSDGEKTLTHTDALTTYDLIPQNDMELLTQAIANLGEKLGTQISEISVKLDNLEKLLFQEYAHRSTSEKLDDSEQIFPLDTTDTVSSFEEHLSNDKYRGKILGHFRRISGSGQPWKSVCYKLSSILFTKKLLTFYSWTGASRTDVSKKPFHKLVNILDVFFQVVKYADNTFTHLLKEQFFRDCILKHSNTRLKKKVLKDQVNVSKPENIDIQEAEIPNEDQDTLK